MKNYGLELTIKRYETIIQRYVELSKLSDYNKERFLAKIQDMTQKLSFLYQQRDNES